jgi:hypothetical protein
MATGSELKSFTLDLDELGWTSCLLVTSAGFRSSLL